MINFNTHAKRVSFLKTEILKLEKSGELKNVSQRYLAENLGACRKTVRQILKEFKLDTIRVNRKRIMTAKIKQTILNILSEKQESGVDFLDINGFKEELLKKGTKRAYKTIRLFLVNLEQESMIFAYLSNRKRIYSLKNDLLIVKEDLKQKSEQIAKELENMINDTEKRIIHKSLRFLAESFNVSKFFLKQILKERNISCKKIKRARSEYKIKKRPSVRIIKEIRVKQLKLVKEQNENGNFGFCDFSLRNSNCLNRVEPKKSIQLYPGLGRFLCKNCVSLIK